MDGSSRSLWLGGAALALGLLIVAALGTDSPIELLSELFAWGIVLIGMFVVAVARRRYHESTPRGRLLMLVLGDLLLVALAVGVVALAYARAHERALSTACNIAVWTWGEGERARAYEESERLRTSSWHRTAASILGGLDTDCELADLERARVEDGRCPHFRRINGPCRCGEQRWPEDLPCEGRPQCRGPEGDEELVCPADERPAPPSLDELHEQLDEVNQFLDEASAGRSP